MTKKFVARPYIPQTGERMMAKKKTSIVSSMVQGIYKFIDETIKALPNEEKQEVLEQVESHCNAMAEGISEEIANEED